MTEDSYAPTEKLTPFLWRKAKAHDPSMAYYLHWCQGCGHAHTYPTGRILADHDWSFNGNIAKPSFAPSMRIFIPAHSDGEFQHPEETVCHYFVTDGQIQYQSDCRHELRGQTLPLEPIPEDYGF